MASQTITGPGIQYTQDNLHCFAYSGEYSTTTSSQIVIQFTTPSAYLLIDVYFTGPTQFSDPNSGREANWQVSFNDIVIATAHTDTSEGDIVQQPQLKLLVPPFTDVKIEVDGNDSAALMKNCALLTGRVYEHLPVRN